MSQIAVTGNLVHDAHLVALALEHGVHEILTLDEDFRRFPADRMPQSLLVAARPARIRCILSCHTVSCLPEQLAGPASRICSSASRQNAAQSSSLL